MEFKKEDGRIYLEDENNNLIAEIIYENVGNDNYEITHTFVDKSKRGQGIASKLVEEAVKEIEKINGNPIPICSYAKEWFEKNKK